MSMSIHNSIIKWANAEHTASDARGLLSRNLVAELKDHIDAESRSIHNSDLLEIIFDTVKNPELRKELSTSGRSVLSLAVTDLKRQCKRDIENSPPQSFFAKVAFMVSRGSKAIDAVGDKINHKLQKADAARLMELVEKPHEKKNESELAGLIKTVLPFLPKRERQHVCSKIALDYIADEIFKKGDLGVVKSLTKELYKTGMLYSACRRFLLQMVYKPMSEVLWSTPLKRK